MFTFFRRIRKSFLSTGASRRYLLYAIGEIALVVIGILIALQVNNWNNNNIRRSDETGILTEMRNTLQIDVDNFTTKLEQVKIIENRIESLQNALITKEFVDSIDILCGAVYGIIRFNLNTASYEELKSSGFNLVSDDTLRRLIIKVYDTHLKWIEHTNNIENNVILDALRPYYLQHFTHIQFSEIAVPKDVEFLYSDEYFLNLIEYRLTVLRTLILNIYAEVISDMSELIIRINNIINGRY